MSDAPSQSQDKFIVRLPDGMRDRIKAAADEANRSMNAEIVSALEHWLSYVDHFRVQSAEPDSRDGTEEDETTFSVVRSPEDVERVVREITERSAERMRRDMLSLFLAPTKK